MHTKRILTVSIILLVATSITHAETLTSPSHTLTNPRIVISGGSATSLNYSLSYVTIGSTTGGFARSNTYSLDVTGRELEKQFPPDIIPPTIAIDSVSPADGTLAYKENRLLISCRAADNIPWPLRYRFLLNNEILAEWTTTAFYDWNTIERATGLYSIQVEVKDSSGNTQASETNEVYLIHEPPGLP